MSASIDPRAGYAVIQHDGVDSIQFDNNGLKSGLGLAFAGAIHGLTLSNNATDANNDIDIAVGGARDATDTETMSITSVITKQLDAIWVAGSNIGGLFSGTKAINTWYHVFLIRKDSDGSVDAGFDTSVTAANIPTGYTSYRRIGSVLTDGAANILQFTQNGDDFDLHVVVSNLSGALPTASRTAITLTTPLDVITKAKINASIVSTGGVSTYINVTPLFVPDVAADGTNYTVWSGDGTSGYTQGSQAEIITDTNSQVGVRGQPANTGHIRTRGWIDNRDQY